MNDDQKELQRLWDTYLLQTWRSAGTLLDVVTKFNAQVSKDIYTCGIRRIPPQGYPWQIGVRVFVAERLEKIGNRMWDMPAEKDTALIDKLQTSTYDTANQKTNPDNEMQVVRRQLKRNNAKVVLETKNYSNRNKKTDWNTVK